jgi:hypothetical protein
MNTTLAALVSLAASRDEDYANYNENKSENKDVDENESVDHDVDGPSAVAE